MSTENIIISIRNSINNILDNLKDGEKIITSDLIDRVIADTKIKLSIANSIIPILLKEFVEEGKGSMERGRNGGYYKGKKIQRIDMRKRCETCHQVIRNISPQSADNQELSEDIVKELMDDEG